MGSVINDTLLAIKAAFEAGVNIFNNGTAVSSSNPLPVAQTDGLSVSGTATSAAVLFTTSMLNYESITVQVTSGGTSCIISYETSDDNTNWVSTVGLNITSNGSPSVATTSTTALMIQFSRKGLYFRARVSTYGSGTVTVVGTLSKAPAVNTFPAIYSTHSEANTVANGTFGITVEARASTKTPVNNSTFVRPIATTDGRLITRLNSIPENEWSYVAASGGITNTTTPVHIAGGVGSGIRNYVTSLQLYSDTLGTATEVVIRDGVAGAVLWRAKIGTEGTAGIQNIRFSTPLRGSSNTLLEAACVTATGTGSIYLNAQGYKAP